MSFNEKMSIIHRAISKHGEDAQLIVAIEELSELQKEICKHLRGQENIDHIIEEMADVRIMLLQMQVIFHIETEELELTERWKLGRLRERMIEDDIIRNKQRT